MVPIWVFGKYGFTSAVAYDPTKDREPKSPFRDIAKKAGTHILVRARIKEDLEDVRERVCPSMVIDTQISADYSFRAVIPRSLFKKYLALMVDEIDYDSHFKEVAEKHGKGVKGSDRHSAMMKTWSAMASLQPYSPYGGGGSFFGSGSDYYGDYEHGFGDYGAGWTSTKKGKVSTPSKAPAKATKAVAIGSGALSEGFATMDEFLDAYVASNGELSYRAGNGPRHGFQVKDRVEGYFGLGTVTAVSPLKATDCDLITVKPDTKTRPTGNFMANFLIPADLMKRYSFEPTDLDDDGDDPFSDAVDELDSVRSGPLLTMEEMKDFLLDSPNLSHISTEALGLMDDEAFELTTRLQEAYGIDAHVTSEQVDEFYSEIEWETFSREDKISWAESDREVPAKYEGEAVSLVLGKDSENA